MLTLFTDTDCDITPAVALKYGYKLIYMPYYIDGKEMIPYKDGDDFDYKDFYDRLRTGVVPKTFAINPYDYVNYFEPEFKKGNDIVYVHFSKAMSGTFNALNIALEDLKDRYPERKVTLIDTRGITVLGYQIVTQIGKLFQEGKSLEEVLAWADKEIDHFTVYFFSSDLKFFQRSGRVSGLSALFGSMLGIHPIIYINEEGKMVNIAKAKGKQGAINKLLSYIDEIGDHIEDYPIYIAHSDALDVAKKLGDMLQAKYEKPLNIEYIAVNPTIGSHCGPSSVGICFHSKCR